MVSWVGVAMSHRIFYLQLWGRKSVKANLNFYIYMCRCISFQFEGFCLINSILYNQTSSYLLVDLNIVVFSIFLDGEGKIGAFSKCKHSTMCWHYTEWIHKVVPHLDCSCFSWPSHNMSSMLKCALGSTKFAQYQISNLIFFFFKWYTLKWCFLQAEKKDSCKHPPPKKYTTPH